MRIRVNNLTKACISEINRSFEFDLPDGVTVGETYIEGDGISLTYIADVIGDVTHYQGYSLGKYGGLSKNEVEARHRWARKIRSTVTDVMLGPAIGYPYE